MEKKNSQDLALFVTEQFSNFSLPVSNGFILFLLHHKRIALVDICDHLCQYNYMKSNTLHLNIKKIDSQYRDFKKHIPRNWWKIIEFLKREFDVQPEDCDNIQKSEEMKERKRQELANSNLSKSNDSTPSSAMETANSKPAYNLRGGDDLTPKEARLQNRLSHLSVTQVKERKRYRETLKCYRNRILSFPPSVKSAQKIIQRKDKRLAILKARLRAAKIECSSKKLRVPKKDNQNSPKMKDSSEQISSLITLLAERKTLLQNLQKDWLLLKSKVDDIESFLRPDKSDNRVGLEEVSLMIQDCIENKVPTSCIPSLIINLTSRMGVRVDLGPQQHSIEQMVKDMVLVTNVQTEETLQTVEIFVTCESVS
ncbi:hypothetical protein Bpfe_003714 [Biomphalaria pfeifferi]|uniref:Uncharacterized protein n=1 Tax=Biomphalaria pfeifferi TaxID=112525 RepID=A0AAD8FL02_BIOPF|nr:hypothetical protein Bpfe_003714 [Biomphalaria pfeifferi]